MDTRKPTTQLLGRFQPWHKGHTELFKRALSKTGQVAILLREYDNTSKNPFDYAERESQILHALGLDGYSRGVHYDIYRMPNITHITYGRDVGYIIEQEHLDKETELISATKIRELSVSA
jgi:nicotinamide mononucleotide adenylyltransferase